MRLPLRRVPGSLGFNMTPMIDVVFLLIIFFLVSSHLAQQEVQLELDLPTAASGHRPDEDRGTRRVTVNVVQKNVAAGKEVTILLGGAEVDGVELARRLAFEAAHSGNDLEVRIRSDRRVPYRFVEPVMVACARAGAWNVTFAVTRKEE